MPPPKSPPKSPPRPPPPKTAAAAPATTPRGLRLERKPSADALAEMDARCFEDHWHSAEYESFLNNAWVEGWLLIHEETGPMGLLSFQHAAGEGEIYRIGIVAEARNRGWGRWLLEALLAEGRERGWTKIFLDVRESNQPARRLYAQCGFQLTGWRHFYYREPLEKAVGYTFFFEDVAEKVAGTKG